MLSIDNSNMVGTNIKAPNLVSNTESLSVVFCVMLPTEQWKFYFIHYTTT